MKIAILGNQARATSNFWSTLIRELRGAGHETLCLVPPPGQRASDAEWNAALAGAGARVVHYPLSRKGLNPVSDVITVLSLRGLFRREQPDVLFAFTIKPVIYGILASALAGFPEKPRRLVMITGLGYAFEGDTPLKRLLTRAAAFLYRQSFSRAATAFFQNKEDLDVFTRRNIIPAGTRVVMCPGTGVDIGRFVPAPRPDGPMTFLLIGRLLEAKGLREFHDAARLLKARYPEARFRILGPPETGLGSVPLETVRAWEAEGVVEYLGETFDVRPCLADCHVFVLPSYREGAPTSVMEAMAVSRACVVTDVPGCRETVKDGENGFLVPARDAAALAAAMERFLLAPGLVRTMGDAGRKMAEAAFDARAIARMLMAEMGLARR